MNKLEIINNKKSNDTVTRTIRISKKVFDKINSIAEEENISFNKEQIWKKKNVYNVKAKKNYIN